LQHEFTLKVLYRDVGNIISALNTIGVHQLFYTVPIEIVPDENGYDYVENENIPTDLKIYIDLKQLPEFQIQIKEVLSPYDYELTEQAAAADEGPACLPIELRNGWVICSPQQAAVAYSSERYLLYDPRGSLGTDLNGTTRGCLEFI